MRGREVERAWGHAWWRLDMEESQRVHLSPRSGRWLPDNSRLQRHIGIAVAFNVWTYFEATAQRLDLHAEEHDRWRELTRKMLAPLRSTTTWHAPAHGSPLSAMVHSWVLARTDPVQSWQYFTRALESDVSDTQGGTTAEGIHLVFGSGRRSRR